MSYLKYAILLLLLLPQLLMAQEIKEQTSGERLVRLEEGQKNLEKRLEDLRRDINTRFDDMNNRFNDMRFWLQFILGTVVLILAGLIAQWMLLWKRMSQVEAKVDERLVLGFKEEEIRELKRRLQQLEMKLTV